MKRSLFVKVVFALALISTIGFSGCKKNKSNPVSEGDVVSIQITDAQNPEFVEEPQNWHITDKRLCVLFGYGFNAKEEYTPIMEKLQARYGVDEDGGLIFPLIYGESFKRGVKGYATELAADLEGQDKELIGIVILGAPENTHKALAKHQDFWDQEVPFPVISLFPQDDVLGMESTCDIVIDKAQSADISGNVEDAQASNYEEAPEILADTIDYIIASGTSFKKNTILQVHVQQMLKNREFHRYVDPESGLQSINHFVLN